MTNEGIAAALYVVAAVSAAYQLTRFVFRGDKQPAFGWWRW